MKNILTIIAILFCLNANAQNAKVTKEGNYTAITKVSSDSATYKDSGKTFTDAKGKVYKVYISAHQKLFVIKTSAKSGKEYKMYLKTEKVED